MWSVNGINYNISSENRNAVVIDVAASLGYDIPRFCYHEGLKIAGNCRMCLVEDTKAAKPVVSCAMSLTAGLDIFTNTVRVKKARESVMEFLLINHPLDCPICDQGGECDLQDLSVVYGSDSGRFYEYKRNVEDKNCGPIVKTIMNRCILCTRCVRFASDIAGFSALGTTGRGMHSEIGSYLEKIIDSDLSGNLIDICPVGALTSKPYAFAARPWELKRSVTLNVLDDELQLIRADVKENELLRIMPSKNNNKLNSWITNRVRFSYEGLKRARSVIPIILATPLNWISALSVLAKTIAHLVTHSTSNSNLKISVNDNTLSGQDLLISKHLSLNSGWDYVSDFGAISSLSASYYTLLGSTNIPWIINLDLTYAAPILALQLKQQNRTLVSWAGRNMSGIPIAGAVNTLKLAFRHKTWHSILGKRTLITHYKIADWVQFDNNAVLYENSTARTAALMGLKCTRPSNKVLSPTILNYSLGESSSSSSLDISQASHLVSEALAYLPSASVYEQSNKIYYDSSYSIKRTTRILSSAYRDSSDIIRALANITSAMVRVDNENLSSYLTKNRLILKRVLSDYVATPKYLHLNRSNYYSNYALTAYSPTLRYENNFSIYKC